MNYVNQITRDLTRELRGGDPELLRYYTLLVLTNGTSTSLEDVHDAWSMWQADVKADHKSLIPFEELALDIQEYDRKYRDAIRKVAAERFI